MGEWEGVVCPIHLKGTGTGASGGGDYMGGWIFFLASFSFSFSRAVLGIDVEVKKSIEAMTVGGGRCVAVS